MKIIKKLFLGALCAGLLSVPSTLDKVDAANTVNIAGQMNGWSTTATPFTDVDGNHYIYEVLEVEILKPTDVDEMVNNIKSKKFF